MVDTIRAAGQQTPQIQSNSSSPSSAQQKRTAERDDRAEQASTTRADRSSNDTNTQESRAVSSSRETASSSEDLRERALQLLDKQAANSSNAGSSSIRRGSVLDITA